MSRGKSVKQWDKSSFLETLEAKTGDYKVKKTADEILHWATENGLWEEPQKEGGRADSGYVVLLDHGGEKFRLFKVLVSGDVQFQTGEVRDADWFQQKPPFDQPEMRTLLHEKLSPLPEKAFPARSEQKDEMRLALRAVACLPCFRPEDKKDKPKLALRWLEGQDTRDLFLEVFGWVVDTIRTHHAKTAS